MDNVKKEDAVNNFNERMDEYKNWKKGAKPPVESAEA